MVLLQQAAVTASQYFEHVEIIELHHNQKADAPSGTAIQTAQMLAEMGKTFNLPEVEETEKLAGARGSVADEGIRIHSIRLPGLIAHQEVIFGGAGSSLYFTTRYERSSLLYARSLAVYTQSPGTAIARLRPGKDLVVISH
jgi:4-hydroxy-tetrahydrodipicolinate reductase